MAGNSNSNKAPTKTNKSSKASSGAVTINNNDVARVKILLDTLSTPKHAASALSSLVQKRKDTMTLTKGDLTGLEIVINALNRVTTDGFKQAAAVSPLPNVIQGYNLATKEERESEKSADPLDLLKAFVKPTPMKKKQQKRNVLETSPVPSSNKKVRRSGREKTIITHKLTEEQSRKLYKEFDGRPPGTDQKWERATLCSELSRLEVLIAEGYIERKKLTLKQFILNVLAKGKSDYNSYSGVCSMYGMYKKDKVVPTGRGRKSIMSVEKASAAAKKVLNDRSSKSSTFQLGGMKSAYTEVLKDKAEQNGLERDTVRVKVSSATAKAAMIALVMKNPDLGMTRKKLLTKSESRFQSEHSVMCAKAYALTCLSTHFVGGHRPANLEHFKPENLSQSAKETMEWVRVAYGEEQIWPIDPNLVLSTDDTTVFVFEGTKRGDGEEEWEWKIIDKSSERSSVRSDFEVGEDAENSGGLRIRLTVTFTASGLAAPPYIAVSGLTEEELSPEKCPSGILTAQIPGLCKGGNDMHNNGFGWLVFLRADKKGQKTKDGEDFLSIANKKFIHYNDKVLLPFIQAIRETLGWKRGTPVPECLKACSWFDGDIGQLQTMLYEAREALDNAEKICRNKHSAASTGTQQPCDLAPVFRLLKQISNKSTAKDSVLCGLPQIVDEYFSNYLRLEGLNLDGNPRKKKALIDFLCCIPDILESTMKPDHIKLGFIEAGMIDEETNYVPDYNKLMATCKRWVSDKPNIGVPVDEKKHCREQFQHLMKIQMDNGQVSYEDMIKAGLPRDIASDGSVVQQNRPSGADAEHRQAAKTINAEYQKRLREQKRRNKISEAHAKAVRDRNAIIAILEENRKVEEELLNLRDGMTLNDLTVQDFMNLKKPQVSKLKAFIHARKFTGATFQSKDLVGTDGKLNLVRQSGQSAESIENGCSFEEPCLVWLAWKLRSTDIILNAGEAPTLNLSVQVPMFEAVEAGPSQQKSASDYLSDNDWVNSFQTTVKGRISTMAITDEMKINADKLESALLNRLNLHISQRVDVSKQKHWTINRFTPDNLAPMAASMYLMGHIVDSVEWRRMDECLLKMPEHELFSIIEDGDTKLGNLEGCYLFYDWERCSFIRSGKTSGTGENACFSGRIKQHRKNASSKDQMKEHLLYAKYPARGVENLGNPEGIFEDLAIYCGMAFDSSAGVSNLCSSGESDSLFVWSEEVMEELKKKTGSIQKFQLDLVAYLWEICYDLLLAERDNVSVSPGFESFGLRVNRSGRKRKTCYD